MKKIENSINKISLLKKGLEKTDPYIDELIKKLEKLEEKMLEGLEKDEQIKAQKKAS